MMPSGLLAALVLVSVFQIAQSASSEGGQPVCYGPVKVTADIIGFILITSATLYIAYKNATYKGPSGNERNFNGYREENMIALFINLFASVAYWARIISNAQCSPGFVMLTHIRYCDYLTTCPLLVLDLLWNLEAPYKCTYAGLILITLLTGVACSLLPAPQNYMWFVFGDLIFFFVYWQLVIIVRGRVAFFVARAKNEMAIKAMYYIKFACACFFLIWIWFPLLWIVSPYCLNIMNIEYLDLCHMFLDVCAKSVYGVVLLWFRWHYDKKLLRNIDDEEFQEFSSKCPDRQAVMQIMVGDSDDERENGEHGGHSPMAGKMNPQSHASEGKTPLGVGSRLLFESNRRHISSSPEPPPAAFQRAAPHGIHSVSSNRPESNPRLYRSTDGAISSRDTTANPRTVTQERWLMGLGTYLEQQGVGSPAVVTDILARLDQSGLIEEQLRTCVTEEDLLELGISTPACRAILSRYANGGNGINPTNQGMPNAWNDAPMEMRAWSPRVLS